MSASNKNVPLALMAFAALSAFLILMKSIQGDSVLRIVLAAGGFVGFSGLYVAVLLAKAGKPPVEAVTSLGVTPLA